MEKSFFIRPEVTLFDVEGLSLEANAIKIFTAAARSEIAINSLGWVGIYGYKYLKGTVRSDKDATLYVQYSHIGENLAACSRAAYQTAFTLDSITDASDGVATFFTCGFESTVIAPYARIILVNGVDIASDVNLFVFGDTI